ncbi:MAG: GNAT family N-acetyltransferase [Planctomycetes bacterium]|nr:GNAT family N-acetyltransferase [Planctomycetota bacterium]
MKPEPTTLEGRHVRLEPLAARHAQELFAAAQDDSIWRYLTIARPRELGELERHIAQALLLQECGEQLPFAIVDRASARVAGSTRLMDLRLEHRGLEIGWTWIAPEFQRTALNTECKLLLLTHAFEALGCLRVQLKTDARNLRSQTAIERLGARKEGVLRKHFVLHDGFVRDSVMYSITDAEWPAVKRGLLERLSASRPSAP